MVTAVATPKHINLDALAIRIIEAGAGSLFVPIHDVVSMDAYKARLVEHLRRDRLAMTDFVFRTRYGRYF